MDQYLSTLTKLRDLLALCGDPYWEPRVSAFVREYQQLQDGREEGPTYFDHFQKVALALSGGMGSLSDLTLSLPGGHRGDEESLKVANREKDVLLDELYDIATARMRELGPNH